MITKQELLDKIEQANSNDEYLRIVRKYIIHGIPSFKKTKNRINIITMIKIIKTPKYIYFLYYNKLYFMYLTYFQYHLLFFLLKISQ